MESAAVPSPTAPASGGVEDKGLKKNAIGFVSSVVIGVASTAPGYSLAATLGFVAAAVALQSPAILLISFIPMFLVAGGYYYLNKADPDCGTSFSWVTKAMGPQLGWIAGWTIVVADIIVMANLAQIAGLYSFELFGWTAAAESTVAVTAVGVVWIVIMTAIVVIGIELSARTQVGLLAAEIVTLALFSVVALIKVYSGDAPDASIHPSLSWINPFSLSPSEISAGMLLGRLHLLGLGHDRDGQRGDRGLQRGAGQGDRDQHPDPARDLPRRRRRGAVLRRRRKPDREPGRRAQLARHRSLRLAAGQDPDHRRADLGGGLDPDDDPADGADDALDGAGEGDAGEPRQGPPPLPHPAHLDDPDGGRSRSSGTSA